MSFSELLGLSRFGARKDETEKKGKREKKRGRRRQKGIREVIQRLRVEGREETEGNRE